MNLMQPNEAVDGLRPLCVDLDGTLISSDLLLESFLFLLRKKPWMLLACVIWILQGRARLKRKLAEHTSISVESLPYNDEVVKWLREEKARGRTLVLASASDDLLVQKVVRHLGIFDAAFGSDGVHNRKGRLKLAVLREQYGEDFDYCGNSPADFTIWKQCRGAVLVNPNLSLHRRAKREFDMIRVFHSPRAGLALLECLRPIHWVKNLLIFLPLVTAHRLLDPALLLKAGIMFAAFSLIASGVYVVNDLVDVEADRQHRIKRNRPFASGRLSLLHGLLLPIPLFGGGMLIAVTLSAGGQAILLIYLVLTSLYSFWLKKQLLLDVLSLGILYLLRVIAGHEATGIPYSPWLLSFCVFLFISLALCKRASELRNLREGEGVLPGRGYRIEDETVVTIAGVASGFAACVVFILYLNSNVVLHLYKQPELMWLQVPAILYWICRMWMLAGRGKMNEDPILFAVRDRATYAVAAWCGALLLLSSYQWFPRLEFIR